jgi:hypothetical protein
MLALRSFARPRLTVGAVRHLNVHEYVSMEIMQAHGIKTPNCSVASTPEEAEQIFVHKLNKRKLYLCDRRTIVRYTRVLTNTHTHTHISFSL